MILAPARAALAARRVAFGLLVIGTGAAGTAMLARILADQAAAGGHAPALILPLFWVSFTWLAYGCWPAAIGFALQLRRRRGPAAAAGVPVRVAVVMPIYNEDTARVFANIVAVYRSVAESGAFDAFDFFVLSDSTDPDRAIAEEALWHETTGALGAQGRLFYRRRTDNAGRKAGNIADWVRHWGGAYEGFVILDADSVMTGACLATLARLLADDPEAGLIQTFTVAVGRETAFARGLQFVHRLAGPLLAEGHAWWQGGDSNYFGHNAIIRTRAFAAHCGLPALAGAPPFGGEILSHDFVEAALLRRGGWRVYAVPRLAGSYEELPSNVIDYAARDRRWLQGNLQHALVIPARGLTWLSRLHLVTGILSFLASPLWLALVLGAVTMTVAPDADLGCCAGPIDARLLALGIADALPDADRAGDSRATIGTLLGMTALLLLLPRLLGAIAVLLRGPLRRAYGGAAAVMASMMAELALSTLLAPGLMLLHTTFIGATLTGRTIGWRAQPRDDRGIAWRDAAARLWWITAAGVALGVHAWLRTPLLVPWLSPVIAGMVLAIPLAVLGSRPDLGRALARRGLFAIPEERVPPRVLLQRDATLARLSRVALPGAADLERDAALLDVHRVVAQSRYAQRGQRAAPRDSSRTGTASPSFSPEATDRS